MTITKNALVTLDYRLTTTDGECLNPDEEPLIYLHGGHGQLFAKVEAALEGKQPGDTVRVELMPEEAFGAYDEELVVEEALSELPEDIFVGMEVDGYMEENPDDVIIYTVTEVRDDTAVLNGNHPMAGMSLVFEGTVQDVQEIGEDAVREILEHEHHH
jgi:FKBP-type peptidyl-prolyl cis-trans isomerase SlyD